MPSNFSEGIELEMRFSPMKIAEGKCASKYCEVISAETLLDLSDAQNCWENFTLKAVTIN